MRTHRITALIVALGISMAGCSSPVAPDASPASAGSSSIVNGQPTGAQYGNVGALLYDFDGGGAINGDDLLCTGSLIGPARFLTAGHCAAGFPAGTQFYVTFAADLNAPGIPLIAATGVTVAGPARSGDPIDLAIVHLPAGATAGIAPLTVAPADWLTQEASQGGLRGAVFVNVGYGADATRRGRPALEYRELREVSTSLFSSLDRHFLNLQMNENATGRGGDCYGDSGGPKFPNGNTSMIVATVSFGDRPCRALSKSYRLDTPSAQQFLGR